MTRLTGSLALPQGNSASLHGPALQKRANSHFVLLGYQHNDRVADERGATPLLARKRAEDRLHDFFPLHKSEKLHVRKSGLRFYLIAGNGYHTTHRQYLLQQRDVEI